MKFAAVLAGGAVGALARYLASVAIMERYPGRFPMGTLLVNVSGCFLIGLLMPLLSERVGLNPVWRLLLVTGFLGGYTTFSSFEWETFQAVRTADKWSGMVNVVASVAFGYLAVWLGSIVAAMWRK